MAKSKYRVVTRGANGEIRSRDFADADALLQLHSQIGIEDSSTDLTLRGLPVFRGLIGPMPETEDKQVVRYESPEVFETLTKEWTNQKPERKTRRRARGSAPKSNADTNKA